MKKFIGAIASAVTGVLAFIFLALPGLKYSMGSESETTSGYKLITEDLTHDGLLSIDGYTLYKIFAIVSLIVAALLIVSAVIIVLQQVGVIKTELNFGFINAIILVVFAVVAIVTMIGGIVMANSLGKDIPSGFDVSYSVGIGLILMAVVGVIAAALNAFFVFFKKSK